MPEWIKKRALTEWIRLFPIPYRLMTEERRFQKWHWINVEAIKATNDLRPESFTVNQDSIVVGEHVPPKDGWQQRRRRNYGGKWESAFRQRYEKEMIEKNDTHFFVGTLHQYPKSWIIVGLFYPPKPASH